MCANFWCHKLKSFQFLHLSSMKHHHFVRFYGCILVLPKPCDLKLWIYWNLSQTHGSTFHNQSCLRISTQIMSICFLLWLDFRFLQGAGREVFSIKRLQSNSFQWAEFSYRSPCILQTSKCVGWIECNKLLIAVQTKKGLPTIFVSWSQTSHTLWECLCQYLRTVCLLSQTTYHSSKLNNARIEHYSCQEVV